ncbi:MAG: hypothetical protein JRN20_05760 [Nitrososphaerota archaeon]|nr:hypothetical protein [Nitrososphaerota archaeon]MDG6921860.1 hypothetical protein [Nitrososphaerota archaeon]
MTEQSIPKLESTGANSIERRLDALIRMTILILANDNKKMDLGEIIRAIHSAGLSPSEIGRIMGKDRKYVSPFIYGLKSGKKEKNNGK